MKKTFAILFILLLVKDTVPLSFGQYLRVAGELLAFLVGIFFIMSGSKKIHHKYVSVMYLYLIALTASAMNSHALWPALWQVLSVTAVIIFFVAFTGWAAGHDGAHQSATFSLVVALAVVCLASIVVFKINPNYTFDRSVLPWRYKGLFGKPGTMGAASGLLVGLSLFLPSRHRIMYAFRMLFCLVGLYNLYYCGARTFWIATVFGICAYVFVYERSKLSRYLPAALTALLFAYLLAWSGVGFGVSDRLRSDSLETASGRTEIWTLALDLFWKEPILGYGLTRGADAFSIHRDSIRNKASEYSIVREQKFNLHNGYIQALLDSGLVGFMLYCAIIIKSIYRCAWFLRDKRYGYLLYALVFLTVGNLGESVIYSAATTHAVFFWYASVVALTLGRTTGRLE